LRVKPAETVNINKSELPTQPPHLNHLDNREQHKTAAKIMPGMPLTLQILHHEDNKILQITITARNNKPLNQPLQTFAFIFGEQLKTQPTGQDLDQ
jgi:hypothetical protein